MNKFSSIYNYIWLHTAWDSLLVNPTHISNNTISFDKPILDSELTYGMLNKAILRAIDQPTKTLALLRAIDQPTKNTRDM